MGQILIFFLIQAETVSKDDRQENAEGSSEGLKWPVKLLEANQKEKRKKKEQQIKAKLLLIYLGLNARAAAAQAQKSDLGSAKMSLN